MNRKVHGMGTYDGLHESKTKAYVTWADMLKRCYNPKYKGNLAYSETEVCVEWLLFSNFREWFDSNYQEGFVLDKDLIDGKGVLYSPDTCLFLPQELNSLLINCVGCKGFTKTKSKGIYEVSFSSYINKTVVRVGRVKGEDNANLVYRVNKFHYSVHRLQSFKDAKEICNDTYEVVLKRLVSTLLTGYVEVYPLNIEKFNKKYVLPIGVRYS